MTKKLYKTDLSVALLDLFNNIKKPISYSAIAQELAKTAITFNKSTLYRQLARLEESKQIQSITTSNAQQWEKYNEAKHAHLECQNCHKIVCLDFGSINISNTIKFQINSINLNGICAECI
jgi:Fe2+ or Zn2+ uptake regulation protein